MIYLLHQGLTASAERDPDHPALRYPGPGGMETLSYGQLEQRSNRLAHLLRERGIGRWDRVGVFMNKRIETLVAIYGIMKAGAAYVPIDPHSPGARLHAVLNDCGIRCLITTPDKAPAFAYLPTDNLPLQTLIGADTGEIGPFTGIAWDALLGYPGDAAPDVRLVEDDLAYIMVTSGSTGQPKYIMHTHRSGLAYTRQSAATYAITPADRLGNHSPLHFDMSTLEYLTAMQVGATTVIIPEPMTLFPANLSQLIESERLTIWYSVPFVLIQLLQRGALDQRDLSSLRWILYGGEPFARKHIRALMPFLPNARFSNVYGPAEVNQCTVYHIPPPETWPADEAEAAVPIGHLCDNVDALILDANDAIITDGAVGELVVRTPTMMQGYWNRPDLNARAFYRRAIAPDYDAVYYRTGDLVYRRPDGLLDFVGRKDHQVKVRGFRVELAEVDSALNAHPAVAEGAAYLVTRDDMPMIEAVIQAAPDSQPDTAAILAHLRQRLPHYAVPGALHIVDVLPRTGTGKIDRKALAAAVT